MGANPTLYLAFDGVLHPNLVTFRGNGLPRMRAGGHHLFENNALLETLIEECPGTEVVLHSWWVPLVGYRGAVAMLPEEVRRHVVGATWHSGRGMRARRRPSRPRREWLDDDLLRRRPECPVLVDCDAGQVAPMLADVACIVDEWRGLAETGVYERLVALLSSAMVESRFDERLKVSNRTHDVPGIGWQADRIRVRRGTDSLRDGKMAW